MTKRVREIRSENLRVPTNLPPPLNHGRFDGTGRMIILRVDQSFEHGPGWSFCAESLAYNALVLKLYLEKYLIVRKHAGCGVALRGLNMVATTILSQPYDADV